MHSKNNNTHRVRTSNLIFILILLFTFSKLSFSQSCNCPPLQKPDEKYFSEFSLVFTGSVDSVSACDTKSKAWFSIVELFKGECPKLLPVEFDCSSPCMMNFSKGETWLIYGNYKSFGLAEVTFCSRSRKWFPEHEPDYFLVNSGMKFNEEVNLLRNALGSGEILDEKQQGDMQERSLIHPDGKTTLVLLLVSVAGFLLIWYLSKKYFR